MQPSTVWLAFCDATRIVPSQTSAHISQIAQEDQFPEQWRVFDLGAGAMKFKIVIYRQVSFRLKIIALFKPKAPCLSLALVWTFTHLVNIFLIASRLTFCSTASSRIEAATYAVNVGFVNPFAIFVHRTCSAPPLAWFVRLPVSPGSWSDYRV